MVSPDKNKKSASGPAFIAGSGADFFYRRPAAWYSRALHTAAATVEPPLRPMACLLYTSKIAKAIKISRKCIRIVYQNIAFALTVKFACMALGAVGIANMWLAIFADVGVMILALSLIHISWA